MDDVTVTGTAAGIFEVTVRSGDRTTTHRVTVPEGYPGELGWAPGSTAELVRASFGFLLEREPAGSILPSFELPVIARYFPEYPAEIRP